MYQPPSSEPPTEERLVRAQQANSTGREVREANRLGQAESSVDLRVRIGPYTLVEAVEVEEKKGRRRTARREMHALPDCWALPGGGMASVRELRRIASRNGWLLLLPQGVDYLRAMRSRPLHYVACHTTNWDRLGGGA